VTLENDIRLVSLDDTMIDQLPQEFLDWPNLGHYRKENENLGLPSEGEHRIVFMGDSITEEWGHLYPQFFADKQLVNRGIGGQTTPQMLIRFKPDVIDLKPDTVIILAGTNDIAGNTGPASEKMITDNLFAMAELAMFHEIKVVISSILPVYKYEWTDKVEDPPGTIFSINEKVRVFVEKHDLLYLDYYSQMVDEKSGLRSEYSEDGVHPNEAGYKVMSKIAGDMISKISLK
jgi:lysophospholipase L1-like esterase